MSLLHEFNIATKSKMRRSIVTPLKMSSTFFPRPIEYLSDSICEELSRRLNNYSIIGIIILAHFFLSHHNHVSLVMFILFSPHPKTAA
jgi:hypothetical protein